MMEISIRIARAEDAAAVHAILGYYIAHTLVNFAEQNKTVEEQRAEMLAQMERYPFLIAEDENGSILGFACAEPIRSKYGYRYTAELTVYLHPEAPKGYGIGTRLYTVLLDLLTRQGFRKAVGCLYSGNEASIALHRRFGFQQTALLENWCRKHGQWLSAVYYEKVLNPFDDDPQPLIPFREFRKTLPERL